jgi:uncharacterized membrane protein
MSWLQRYHIKLYLRNSIWVLPLLSIVLALVAVRVLSKIEQTLGWQVDISVDNGRVLISTVASSLFTLVVVVSSALLVAVQLASAQLTPRIIAMVYRTTKLKYILAIFAFSFTFSVATLVRLEQNVPWLTTYASAYGFLFCLGLYLYFVDSIGKMLRPSSALSAVAFEGREVIRTVYPRPLNEQLAAELAPIEILDGTPAQIVTNAVDGVVLAFDIKGLISLAERANCMIELVPEVGDFIAQGDPMFRVFGGPQLPADRLRESVALGQERNMEQDPMFGFRITVDIASKALSPAINDPTTAVLAIDQLHHLLRDVGSRYLAEGHEKDQHGAVRLVYRTPYWDDFVRVAVTEVRQYGRDSVQVMRRLRAMLENLIETLPERRTPLLRKELELLTSSSQRTFADREDQILAEISDLQGLGGGQHGKRKRELIQVAVAVASQAADGTTAGHL